MKIAPDLKGNLPKVPDAEPFVALVIQRNDFVAVGGQGVDGVGAIGGVALSLLLIETQGGEKGVEFGLVDK